MTTQAKELFFDWNEDKNIKLIQERNISFDKIIELIQSDVEDNLLEIREHENQEKYPNQKKIYSQSK